VKSNPGGRFGLGTLLLLTAVLDDLRSLGH
jgi:hypothetical protein